MRTPGDKGARTPQDPHAREVGAIFRTAAFLYIDQAGRSGYLNLAKEIGFGRGGYRNHLRRRSGTAVYRSEDESARARIDIYECVALLKEFPDGIMQIAVARGHFLRVEDSRAGDGELLQP